GANGDPAVRMAEFTGKFGANGTFSSICDDSYAPALSQLGATIGRALGPLCLAAPVADTDATKVGIQANCQVIERAPGVADRTLPPPACDPPPPQGGPAPCWYVAPSTTATCPSGVQLQINRTTPPAPGTTLGVHCTSC